MNIESLLEDLEAHFEAESRALTARPPGKIINLLRTVSITGETNEITAPLLGRDFVAGFLDGGSNWLLIRHQWLQSMEPLHRQDANHPQQSFTKKSFQEVVQDFHFPTEISWRYLLQESQQINRGIALSCSNGFLEVSLHPTKYLPLLSIGQIVLKVVEKY